MTSEWREMRLEDLASQVTVGWVGPMAQEYQSEGIPFLRSLNVRPFRIDAEDIRYITPEFHDRIRKSRLTPGDVVIVRTGAPGTAAVVPDWLVEANCSDLVIVRPGPDLDARYLAYYLNAAAQYQIAAEIVGAVQQHFNVGSAKRLRLCLPPLEEQQEIVRVLGALDDKIEANRALNETLEATCQALFRSWFIDFDPVVAKSEGRRPVHLADEVAAIFPDTFGDSPLGPVPAAWRPGVVAEEYALTMGQSPPGSTYNEEGLGLPFYQGRTDFRERYPVRRVYCTAPTRLAEEGDTLVSVRAPVGDTNQALEQCALGRGVGAVRHKRGRTSFTYYQMGALREEFDVFNGYGTLFGSINKGDFSKLPIVVPPPPLVDRFEEMGEPLDATLRANALEEQTLAALRDALLPRLLSGELRVRRAERLVGEAV